MNAFLIVGSFEIYNMNDFSLTLSASVKKDLLLFNDSKTPLPANTVEILTQEICFKVAKMSSSSSRLEELEGKQNFKV